VSLQEISIAVGVIGIVVGLFTTLVSVALWRAGKRPVSPEAIRDKNYRLATSLIWRRNRYFAALKAADSYLDYLDDGASAWDDPRGPSVADILRYAESSILTAAKHLSPYSVGTANLFRFQSHRDPEKQKIVSSLFVGALPPVQVLLGQGNYRDMEVADNAPYRSMSIAAQSVHKRHPLLARVDRSQYASTYELEAGITHILGAPAAPPRGWQTAPAGAPAVVAMDLRMRGLASWWSGKRRTSATKHRLLGRWMLWRARHLSDRLDRLAELEAAHRLQLTNRSQPDGSSVPRTPEPTKSGGDPQTGSD
jgi:hypothetical protein